MEDLFVCPYCESDVFEEKRREAWWKSVELGWCEIYFLCCDCGREFDKPDHILIPAKGE
jgi:DNA-directed RNA polymerase subunit RPC12/RpoP